MSSVVRCIWLTCLLVNLVILVLLGLMLGVRWVRLTVRLVLRVTRLRMLLSMARLRMRLCAGVVRLGVVLLLVRRILEFERVGLVRGNRRMARRF